MQALTTLSASQGGYGCKELVDKTMAPPVYLEISAEDKGARQRRVIADSLVGYFTIKPIGVANTM